MITSQDILQFHFSSTTLKQSAQKIIPITLSTLNEHRIDKLHKISEEVGASSFSFSGNNLIPQVFRKFKSSIGDESGIFERRELRTLSYSLTYSERNLQTIFSNENDKVGTGWGTIFFNRYAKFYFTEHGSYGYDYYVSKNNKLILIQYEYYDDEVNFLKKPKPIIEHLDIKKIDKEIVEIQTKGKSLIFQKQKI